MSRTRLRHPNQPILRLVVRSAAPKHAASRPGIAEAVAELRHLADATHGAAVDGDVRAYYQLDSRFHVTPAWQCPNPHLAQHTNAEALVLNRFINMPYMGQIPLRERSNGDSLGDVVAAIECHDSAAAERAARVHLSYLRARAPAVRRPCSNATQVRASRYRNSIPDEATSSSSAAVQLRRCCGQPTLSHAMGAVLVKPIKIGQIGIGHAHAGAKMETLRRLSDLYEVVGVTEEEDPYRHPGNAYDGLERMSADELLSIPELQAVAVETNMPELVPTAMRCMERGLHMHMDKPGGETLGPFRRLIDGCRARSLAIQLGYMYRNNPAIGFCLRALRDGWLGEVFQIDAVMSRYDGDEYRRFMAGFPGGTMYIFGSHLIDLVIAMLGRPVDVVSFLKPTRDDGLMDNGLAVLEYPRATVTIRASVVEADGMRHRRLLICGTKGTAEICPLEHPGDRYRLDPLHVRLTLREDSPEYPAGTHIVDVGTMNGRYDDQLTELARVVHGEIANPYPYQHELDVQETVLAAAGYTQWGDSIDTQ